MLLLTLVFAGNSIFAQQHAKSLSELLDQHEVICHKIPNRFEDYLMRHEDNPRLVAIGLNIAVGVFGMHRVYLGTNLQVPIFYTFTAGGGGILWLVDLSMLIFTKDIRPFMNNPHVFMWATVEEQKGHSVE
ncbi:MAG: TM2 domain-containing protein [Flavobacteriales bacterium]